MNYTYENLIRGLKPDLAETQKLAPVTAESLNLAPINLENLKPNPALLENLKLKAVTLAAKELAESLKLNSLDLSYFGSTTDSGYSLSLSFTL